MTRVVNDEAETRPQAGDKMASLQQGPMRRQRAAYLSHRGVCGTQVITKTKLKGKNPMMNKGGKTSGIAAAAVGLVLAGAAFAQGPMRGQMPSEMPGMGMMNKGTGMMGMMRMMGECQMMMASDMPTHAQGRIAFLKAELAITDEQTPAWDGYAAALTKNFQAMQGTRQTMMKTMEAKSPVEKLDSHIAAMDGRVAALKEIRPALITLYNALSEDQKKKADQLMTGMGCMM